MNGSMHGRHGSNRDLQWKARTARVVCYVVVVPEISATRYEAKRCLFRAAQPKLFPTEVEDLRHTEQFLQVVMMRAKHFYSWSEKRAVL